MRIVEVFKTNVSSAEQSKELLLHLLATFPGCRINIDLDDCDRVLRVEGENVAAESIMQLITTQGFVCEELM